MNQEFVHWLSPMDDDDLDYILTRAQYQRQINDGAGVLLGYGHDVDYPQHWNLVWLKDYAESQNRRANFFYIDRVIIDKRYNGQGLARALYGDVTRFARQIGYEYLACEVNTRPDNPASHMFHQKMGFKAIGEAEYPDGHAAVRYYEKRL